jgi:hypothetical protein
MATHLAVCSLFLHLQLVELRQLEITIIRCCSFAADRQFVHFQGALGRGNRIQSSATVGYSQDQLSTGQ